MIEENSIIELSNDKKYIIVDSSLEDGNIYYLAMELDYNTEEPTDKSLFFRDLGNGNLSPVKNENDINFLETIFTDRFLNNVKDIEKELGE